MKLLTTAIAVLIIFINFHLYGQETAPMPCGTDEFNQKFLNSNPQLKAYVEKRIAIDNEAIETHPPVPVRAIKVIPVVFHIIHQYGPENVSDAAVRGLIKQLNEDFQLKNSDLSKVRSQFTSVEADMQIEFRLARIDPVGNCTNGINRVVSSLTVNAGDAVKTLIDWDNKKYLNVWVVKSIDAGGSTGTVLGYSYFPYSAQSNPGLDGVVMVASEVGYGYRTLTHEIGHWAGLYHTFQGGCTTTAKCSTSGDYCCDTPPESAQHFNCDLSQNSCSTDSPDQLDMIENYMSYSYCKYMFTANQKTRVDYNMNQYRSNIYSIANLQATGVYDTTNYDCKPVADFMAVPVFTCANVPVKFKNLSLGGTNPLYNWTFNSGSPVSSSDTNPSVTFSVPGKYKISLKVTTTKGIDSMVRDNYIQVFPNIGNMLPVFQGYEDSDALSTFGEYSPAFGSVEWGISPYGYHSGHNSLYLNTFINPDPGQIFYFVLPPVNLTGKSAPSLTYWYAFAKAQSTNTDNLKIYTSSNCGKSWDILTSINQITIATTSTLYDNMEFKPNIPDLWSQRKVDLTSFKGNPELFIKFQFTSGGGNNIYFDDINISEKTGIEQTGNEMAFRIYPSPTNGNLNIYVQNNIQAYDAEIYITDMLGKKILIRKINVQNGDNLFGLDLESMGIRPGVYTVSMESAGISCMRKINFIR